MEKIGPRTHARLCDLSVGDAATGQVVNLYGRSVEARRHLYLPGEGLFNPQGCDNSLVRRTAARLAFEKTLAEGPDRSKP